MTVFESLQISSNTMPSLTARYSQNRKTAGSVKATMIGRRTAQGSATSIKAPDEVFIVQSLCSYLKVLKPFEIAIEAIDNGFVSSFSDANINASGDSADEALDNLISMIGDLYQLFAEEVNQLGPEPTLQYSILQKHLSM
jgi:hypothetical protein